MENPFSFASRYEAEGFWWFPDDTNEKINGRLIYSSKEGISLRLVNALNPDEFPTGFLRPAFDVVMGITDTGIKCTLVKCRPRQMTMHSSGIKIEVIKADFLLIGGHYSDIDKILIKAQKISYHLLDTWIGATPITIEPKPNSPDGTLVATYSEKAIAPIRISELDADFSITPEFNHEIGHPPCSLHWESTYFITLQFQHAIGLDISLSILRDFGDMLTLFMGKGIHPRVVMLSLISPDQTPHDHRPIVENVYLLYQPITPDVSPPEPPNNILIPYSYIENGRTDILNTWFNIASAYRITHNLFFSRTYLDRTFLELDFSIVIQTLESFHRKKFPGKIISNKEYMAYVNILNNVVREIDNVQLRESLYSRIKYGNEVFLRYRLNQLLEDLPSSVLAAISPDPKEFVNLVVNTRNWYTHYDGTPPPTVKNPALLKDITERLAILMTCHFFSLLGIENEYIASAITGSDQYRWYVENLAFS